MAKFNTLIFLKKTMYPLCICLIGFIFHYSFFILLAHFLTKGVFGLYNYVLLITSLLSNFIILGTNANATRFLSIYLKEFDFKDAHEYITWNFKLVLKPILISFTLFTIIFFIVDPLQLYSHHHLSNALKISTTLLFNMPFMAVFVILTTYLICDNKISLNAYFYSIQQNLLSIIFYWVFLNSITSIPKLDICLFLIPLVSIINIITLLIAIKAFSPKIYQLIRISNISEKFKNSKVHSWNINTFLQLINQSLSMVMMKIDNLLLIFFVYSNGDLGSYALALHTADFLKFFPVGIFKYLMPKISSMIENKSRQKEFQSEWNRCLVLNSLFVLIFASSLFFFAKSIVTYLYGIEYLDAVPVLKIIVVTSVFSSISGAKWALLAYTGNVHYESYLYILRIVLCAILVFCFKSYGMIGVAYASLISEIVKDVGLVIVINKKLNFKSLGFI